jgi:ADP-ribose pyrophosphatase YjhB (NUDIX family)
MTHYAYGERIGATAALRVGCSALIWDDTREKILLTRRTDNGRWCLPGGGMDAGERLEETCIREVWEETGLNVRVGKLLGVYSTPHRILVYPDGNRVQIVSMSFEAHVIGGELKLSDETSEFGYFTVEEIRGMDVMEHHVERIEDALTDSSGPVVK